MAEKHIYLFVSNKTGDEIEIEAGGFDEACNIMFGGDDPLDYHEYELQTIDGYY